MAGGGWWVAAHGGWRVATRWVTGGAPRQHKHARTFFTHSLTRPPARPPVHIVPAGADWKTYFQKIPTAKVMLVVQTKALYTSEPCNNEIREALKHSLEVVPLLFETDGIAEYGTEWESAIAEYEMKGDPTSLAKVAAIKLTIKEFGKLNSEPGTSSNPIAIRPTPTSTNANIMKGFWWLEGDI